MPFTVQVNDFESIEAEWEEILPRTKANTIFVTPWWQKVWWRHFGDKAELGAVDNLLVSPDSSNPVITFERQQRRGVHLP